MNSMADRWGEEQAGRGCLLRGCLGVVVIVVALFLLLFVSFFVWDIVNPAPVPAATQLYNALLTAKYPASQLPKDSYPNPLAGYSHPNGTYSIELFKEARKAHEVGAVQLNVAASDPFDAVVYNIYASRSDAAAAMASGQLPSWFLHQHLLKGGVPGYSNRPNRFWLGSERTAGHAVPSPPVALDGVAEPMVVSRNVLVSAIALSGDNTNRGDVPMALALLRSALRHLHAVEATLSHKG